MYTFGTIHIVNKIMERVDSMAVTLKESDFRKVDHNTKKELMENCWRQASGEELNVFKTFYTASHSHRKVARVFRVLFTIMLLVSVAEWMFEMLCKNDPSFDPLPMIVSTIISLFLLFLNEIIYRMNIGKAVLRIADHVYVTAALAYNYADNKVQVMVNRKKLAFTHYQYGQAVSPTDYVYDENNQKIGFHVLLYVVLIDGRCENKVVMGSEEYEIYLTHFHQKSKHGDGVISAKA